MNFEEFKKYNIDENQKLKEAYQKGNFKHNPILPKADIIFEKSYHFMSESLLEKQLRRQKKLQKKSTSESQPNAAGNQQPADAKTVEKQQDAKNNQESDTSIARVENADKDAAAASNPKAAESTQNLEVQEQQKSDEKDNSRTINF